MSSAKRIIFAAGGAAWVSLRSTHPTARIRSEMSKSGESMLRGARQALEYASRPAAAGEGYDPMVAPKPERWLALDEQERINLVLQYHRRVRARLSAAQRNLHASMHAAVENQIAAGEPPVTARTLARLMGQGLNRHEALHAVAAVVAEQIHEALAHGTKPDPAKYEAELDRLTPETWRRDFG